MVNVLSVITLYKNHPFFFFFYFIYFFFLKYIDEHLYNKYCF